MIKILRITGVFAAISAIVVFGFFAFDLVFGIQANENIQRLMDTPDVRGRFENAADNKTKRNDDRISPLVQQAEAFALFLNPPKEKYPKTPFKPGMTGKSISPKVNPKFTVVATSFCKDNPESSLVLIDEPGKGRHWVRQSEKVGYLIIEQIKDGFIVVKNNEETYELTIAEKTGMSISKEISPNSTKMKAKTDSKSTSFTSNRIAMSTNKSTNRNVEDEEKLEELVDMLKDIQMDLETDVNESGMSDEDKTEKMEKLVSNFKSSRIGPEEAKKLGNLGEILQDVQQDPNKSLPAKKGSAKTIQPKPTGK
jgi:hypothetical protein